MSQAKTLVLSGSDLQKIIQQVGVDQFMDELIERLERTLAAFDPLEIKIPVRSGFDYRNPNPGLIEWMPLYQDSKEVLMKVVGYHPSNPDKYNLPTIISTISRYDTSTGHLNCLMDGTLPTALRTGAASAVVSKILGKDNSSILGLIGCGAQSVTQLHALSRLFDFQSVLLYDIDQRSVTSFESRCHALDLNIEFVPSDLKSIVSSSDILCTATSVEVGKGPVFEYTDHNPHLHINAVGSDFPGKIELPKELLMKGLVSPDFREQALKEGECQLLTPEDIGPDITEIMQQQSRFNSAKERLTIFDSTGWALEDHVVMELFMEHASNQKLGKYIEIESLSTDEKSPYQFLHEAALISNF